MRSAIHSLWGILKWTIGTLAMVGIVAFLAGTFTTKIEPGDVAMASDESPPGGEWAAVEQIREPMTERIPGTVEARFETSISSRILATVQQVSVSAGDRIGTGSPLVVLDSRDLASRVTQASESLSGAKARVVEARNEFQRIDALFRENVVPSSRFDESQRTVRVAESEVLRLEQALEEARIGQTFSEISSPFEARVIERFVDPGDTAVPGQALLRIYDPNTLRLAAYVRESLAAHLAEGATVGVVIESLDQSIEATIEEIVPQAEPGSRTFLVKASLPLDDRIFPGMFGRLVLQVGEQELRLIPKSAVSSVGQLDYVWTKGAEGKPVRHLVELGRSAGEDRIEVLAGVGKGEQVLVEGM